MPGGIIDGPPAGSLTQAPLVTTTYQKTVYSPYGHGTCQVTVAVTGSTAAPIQMQAAVGTASPLVLAPAALDSPVDDAVALIDTTFSPPGLGQAAAVVLSAPFQILTDGLTDYFVSMGVR